MDINQRIKSFIQLGDFLRIYSDGIINTDLAKELNEIVLNDHIHNPWFTEQNIKLALNAIGESLRSEKINLWVEKYPKLNKKHSQKKDWSYYCREYSIGWIS